MVTAAGLQSEFEQARASHPGLQAIKAAKDGFEVEGELSVVDNLGYLWDTYNVRIAILRDYPASLPRLFETSGKICRDWSWHTSPKGECCVGTPALQYRKLGTNMTLLNWIQQFAIPYLANHIYKLEKGHYASGEFSHGAKGILEDYESCFGLQGPAAVVQRLLLVLGRKTQSANTPCFCGSGKQYKRCFMRSGAAHRLSIPIAQLERDIGHIRQDVNSGVCET